MPNLDLTYQVDSLKYCQNNKEAKTVKTCQDNKIEVFEEHDNEIILNKVMKKQLVIILGLMIGLLYRNHIARLLPSPVDNL